MIPQELAKYIDSEYQAGKSFEDIAAIFSTALNNAQEQAKIKAEQERQLSLIDCRKNEICTQISSLLSEYLILSGVPQEVIESDTADNLTVIVREAVDNTINSFFKPASTTSPKATDDSTIIKNFINEELRKGDLKAREDEASKNAKTNLNFSFTEEDLDKAIGFLDKFINLLADTEN